MAPGCFVCGAGGPGVFVKLDSNVGYYCDSCTTSMEGRDARGNPKGFVLGIVGALVGALVGSLVWILIGAFGFYASIAGFVISFASVFGYNLLKGPKSNWVPVIIGASVLVAVVFAEIVGLGIAVFKEANANGMQLDLGEVVRFMPEILSNGDVIKDMMPNFLLGLLFAGLGSFRLLKAQMREQRVVTVERL